MFLKVEKFRTLGGVANATVFGQRESMARFSQQNFGLSTNSHDPIQDLNLLRTLLSRTGQQVIVENLAFV